MSTGSCTASRVPTVERKLQKSLAATRRSATSRQLPTRLPRTQHHVTSCELPVHSLWEPSTWLKSLVHQKKSTPLRPSAKEHPAVVVVVVVVVSKTVNYAIHLVNKDFGVTRFGRDTAWPVPVPVPLCRMRVHVILSSRNFTPINDRQHARIGDVLLEPHGCC